jgi:hypothetical protein
MKTFTKSHPIALPYSHSGRLDSLCNLGGRFVTMTCKNKSIENLDVEEWKDIKGYEGRYMISNFGRVKSSQRTLVVNGRNVRISEKIRALNVNTSGYFQVGLYKKCKEESWRVHRLVAIHFIDNPAGVNVVNHIDSNKLNNHVSNLEWCTVADNVHHTIKVGRRKIRRPHTQEEKESLRKAAQRPYVLFDDNGNIYKQFESATHVGSFLNKSVKQIYHLNERGIRKIQGYYCASITQYNKIHGKAEKI